MNEADRFYRIILQKQVPRKMEFLLHVTLLQVQRNVRKG